MPSESVAGFLDRAQASRVLFPEQVEQLIRQPDLPQSDVSTFCEFLLARGVLTKFQAAAIRDGRGDELSFAGYPVIDEVGPCPGGRAYRALHPSLRTPLLLRRLRPEWFAPADNAAGYVARARAFGMLPHPNLVHLLDAGVHRDEVYLVIEQPADAADLETLASEIGGAMPGFLAAEYGRAVASVLRMAHERGGFHGDVRPANLLVGPLVVKTTPAGTLRRRPAPDAVLRVAELGLVPLRPPASAAAPITPPAYLPPERVDGDSFDARGDIYGLGATLYFLLTNRPPFAGDPADVLARVRAVEPAPLSALRPDLPADLVALIEQMMAKRPESRPATAFDVETALSKFCRPGTAPPQTAIPMAAPASSLPGGVPAAAPVLVPVPVEGSAAPEGAFEWGVDPNSFSAAHADADPTPRRRKMSDEEKGRHMMLLILGGLLHLTGIALLVAWLAGAFDSPPRQHDTAPDTTPRETYKEDGNKDDKPKSKVKPRQP
jgi:serine/threonine protein kinase